MYVRDQILATFAEAARVGRVPAERLAEAKSNTRYSFARTLDSTRAHRGRRCRATRRTSARTRRSTTSTGRSTRSRRPICRPRRAKYFTDAGLIVTTLSKDPLPAGDREGCRRSIRAPRAASGATPRPAANRPAPVAVRAPAPAAVDSASMRSCCRNRRRRSVNVKLLFNGGSAHDPAGKEGLAR